MTPIPHPKETTRRRWAKKRDHVLRRVDSDPTITSTARIVAHALAQFSDSTAKPCWPAQETIAAMIGVVAKTVQRAVAELEGAGYLAVRRHPARYKPDRRGFARQTNAYVLRMPKGPVVEYREGQRRRYRSAEWKQRAQAWVQAHRAAPLPDSGEVTSLLEGAHPGAAPPDAVQTHEHSASGGAADTGEPAPAWTGAMTPTVAEAIQAAKAALWAARGGMREHVTAAGRPMRL